MEALMQENKKQISISFSVEEWELIAAHCEIGAKRLREHKKTALPSCTIAHKILNFTRF
jgi:putative heme degradation protein